MGIAPPFIYIVYQKVYTTLYTKYIIPFGCAIAVTQYHNLYIYRGYIWGQALSQGQVEYIY